MTTEYVTPENILEGKTFLPDSPTSIIYTGDGGYTLKIDVDKKFNWFQKKMIKWCFGFDVNENK
jgi:hypothetical protein